MRTGVRFVVCCVALALVAAPAHAAGGKSCGIIVIDEYFATGAVGDHPRRCYAAALGELDADARLYSGIVNAIRSKQLDRARGDTGDGPSGADATNDPTAAALPESSSESAGTPDQPSQDEQTVPGSLASLSDDPVSDYGLAAGVIVGLSAAGGCGALVVGWLRRRC